MPELVLERFYAAYAFDSDGSLIANDAGFDILRVDLSTGNETPIPMAAIPLLAGAADLVVADGIAYGVDDSASIEGVVRVDLTTGAQEIVASKGSLINPQGCAVGPDGMIYVADPGRFGFFEGKVVRIDPDTYDPLDNAFNQDVIVANRTGPTDIAFEASGTLLVTDSSVIVRFDTDGSALGQVGGSFLPMILHDIEIDSEGNAVVAGSDLFQPSNALVSRVSPGGITTVLTTQLIAPRNLAIVPAPEPDAALLAIGCVGSLLVCQRAKKRIAS